MHNLGWISHLRKQEHSKKQNMKVALEANSLMSKRNEKRKTLVNDFPLSFQTTKDEGKNEDEEGKEDENFGDDEKGRTEHLCHKGQSM